MIEILLLRSDDLKPEDQYKVLKEVSPENYDDLDQIFGQIAFDYAGTMGNCSVTHSKDPQGYPVVNIKRAYSDSAWDALIICYHRPPVDRKLSLNELLIRTEKWHIDRNLIDGSTDKDQFLKLVQEMGELSDNICKGKDIRDDIGDMLVVLINIAKRNGVTFEECLRVAYDDIKDRKGRMVDGVFVKEADEQ